MDIRYDKTIWVNDLTPLNASNLNHIEDGIEQATEAIAGYVQDISSVPLVSISSQDWEAMKNNHAFSEEIGEEKLPDPSHEFANASISLAGETLKVKLANHGDDRYSALIAIKENNRVYELGIFLIGNLIYVRCADMV